MKYRCHENFKFSFKVNFNVAVYLSGKASFAQKVHEAKIAPGHASVADVADTAAVSSHSSAASRDVNAARTDVVHDGIAKNAHASHKSYVNAPGDLNHSIASITYQL